MPRVANQRVVAIRCAFGSSVLACGGNDGTLDGTFTERSLQRAYLTLTSNANILM